MIAASMAKGHATRWLRVGLLVCACGNEPEPAPAPAPPQRIEPPLAAGALPVAVHGCVGLTLAPACWRSSDPAPLVLWLAGEQPEGALTVLVDGAPVASGVELDADVEGVRIVADLPAAASRVELVHADGRRFSLALVPEPPAWVAAKRELEGLKVTRPIPEVRTRLLELRAGLGPVEAHRLDCFDAELAFHMKDWAAVVQAPWHLDRTPAPHADLACVDASHLRAALVAIMRRPDYAQARAHLQAARAHPLGLRTMVNADYTTGVLEKRVGRIDEALEWLGLAARVARRTGLHEEHAAAVVQQATALAALGRFDEAKALADAAEAGLDPDNRLLPDIRSNAAWVQILRREDDPTLADPSPALHELSSHYERKGDQPRANGVRLNLAIAATQSRDFVAAERALGQLERDMLHDPAEQVFAELVASRIAEQHRRMPAAREHLERARLLAELGQDEGLVLRARLARADLELRAGRERAALDELAQAELVEDRIALGISASAGRSAFSSARRHDRARYLELRLARGERSAALCTVLAAHARHLRSLRARGERPHTELRAQQDALLLLHHERRTALAERTSTSWALPADELAALRRRLDHELAELDALLSRAMALGEREPAPWHCDDVRRPATDQALLTMHPTPSPGRWWWLLERGGSIDVLEVEHADQGPEAEQAASRALEAFAAGGHLEGVATLVVVPIGALGAVSLHALAPLRTVEVRYAVGLGRTRPPVRVDGSVAVVVGVSQSLREAEAEAAWVGDVLRGAGWPVTSPWTPALDPQPTLLHYAGHGHHGGTTGWGSHLVLADGELGPARIIAHGRAPAIVVLGACDAGTSDPAVIDGGMNVATAFLLAGAALVIAPHGPVGDADARALAEALHADPPDPALPVEELVATLQTRLAAAQRREPRFEQWRAWVP